MQTNQTVEQNNKKLRYREEHSASVVLSWCTLSHLSGDNQQINQFYVTGHESYICDFLLVITYLLSCTVSKLRLIICQIFASDRRALHFNALTGMIPCERKWYAAEN